MKTLGRVLLTIILMIGFASQFWFNQFSPSLTMMVLLIIVFIWTFNAATIKKLSLSWHQNKLEIDQSTEQAKQAAVDVAVTADAFNKTINSFLAFNLSDFQREGRFDATIDWKSAAKFINDAQNMTKQTKQADVELSDLLKIGRAKVFELFIMQNKTVFKEISDEIDQYIHTGLSWQDGLRFDTNYFGIDFNGLAELIKQVPKEKQIYWQGEVKKLKHFYDQNF